MSNGRALQISSVPPVSACICAHMLANHASIDLIPWFAGYQQPESSAQHNASSNNPISFNALLTCPIGPLTSLCLLSMGCPTIHVGTRACAAVWPRTARVNLFPLPPGPPARDPVAYSVPLHERLSSYLCARHWMRSCGQRAGRPWLSPCSPPRIQPGCSPPRMPSNLILVFGGRVISRFWPSGCLLWSAARPCAVCLPTFQFDE